MLMVRRLVGFAAIILLAAVACGGSDPAFTGSYSCSPACASDPYCLLHEGGADTGKPPAAVCTPVGSCSGTPRCTCLLQTCGQSGTCGVATQGYAVVCYAA